MSATLRARTSDAPEGAAETAYRVCVVGSGTRFFSGISVYTNRLANALSGSNRVSVILMRRLLPARWYPGRARVGVALDTLEYRGRVSVYDGVDWYWLPSMLRAIAFLVRHRPQVLIFQWWTGTVLHSYLALMVVGRLLGSRVIIEFHETLDTAEANIPFAHGYVRLLAPIALRLANGYAFHTAADVRDVRSRYRLPRRPRTILPHGPHDHYLADGAAPTQRLRDAPDGVCNILFFGVIRPFKGLEDLVRAFEALCAREPDAYWLTVVGETWEGWTLPTELIEASPWRHRITFVNRYVHDEEVPPLFAGSDVVALPYRRSAISGPVHVAMGFGKPLVVTAVGGLPESVEGYAGAVLTPPEDVEALADAISRASAMRDGQFVHPHDWSDTRTAYQELLHTVVDGPESTDG